MRMRRPRSSKGRISSCKERRPTIKFDKEMLCKIYRHKKVYIYIHISGVKISTLTQEINFFRLMQAANTGAGLGLATPFTTAALCLFFLEKDCVYLDAERLYDHIKSETFQRRANSVSAPGASQTSAEKILCL